MDNAKRVEGIDRYLLTTTAFLFVDLPQAVLAIIPGLQHPSWVWGILGSIAFGLILNAAFGVHMFAPRMGFKMILPFVLEMIPFVGAVSLLSVAMLIVAHFHNKHIDEDEQMAGTGEV